MRSLPITEYLYYYYRRQKVLTRVPYSRVELIRPKNAILPLRLASSTATANEHLRENSSETKVVLIFFRATAIIWTLQI